eukprot:1263040-Prymnesium_polylepis.1
MGEYLMTRTTQGGEPAGACGERPGRRDISYDSLGRIRSTTSIKPVSIVRGQDAERGPTSLAKGAMGVEE